MKLLKEINPEAYFGYDELVKLACEKNLERNKKTTKDMNKFIQGYLTESDYEKAKEYTYQISSMIQKIKIEKELMLDDISTSYLYSSSLQLLCTERAKIYMNAIDRIGEEFDTDLHTYILEYKNL